MSDLRRPSRPATVVVVRVACLVVGVLIAGCAGPTIHDSAITHQAQQSAESMVSELRTAYLVTGAQLDDKTWWRYTDVVVTDAERNATTIESTFGSRQPPTETSQDLYDSTTKALSDATDLLTDLRIAVRKHDETQIGATRDDIAQAADDLETLSEQLQ